MLSSILGVNKLLNLFVRQSCGVLTAADDTTKVCIAHRGDVMVHITLHDKGFA